MWRPHQSERHSHHLLLLLLLLEVEVLGLGGGLGVSLEFWYWSFSCLFVPVAHQGHLCVCPLRVGETIEPSSTTKPPKLKKLTLFGVFEANDTNALCRVNKKGRSEKTRDSNRAARPRRKEGRGKTLYDLDIHHPRQAPFTTTGASLAEPPRPPANTPAQPFYKRLVAQYFARQLRCAASQPRL